jgi:hypothetical protein
MNKKLNQIAGAINKSLRFLFFLLIFQTVLYSQTVSNIDKFYTLVDSASNLLLKDLGSAKKVKLELNLGTDYSLFANQIRGKLLRNGKEIVSDNSLDDNVVNVNFVIDNSNVTYSDPERDGIFGDFFTERTIDLSVNYLISSNQSLKSFNLTSKDTINVKDVENVENRSYPFTQGELPPEPFFSSLLEPIVAIGSAAVIIVLFFSVRSK